MNPRFSVIIPTLNEEKFLSHLLDSLVQQSLKDFEVIVVDGSSKDRTVAVARDYQRKLTLRVVVSQHASLPLQRNVGAQHARGSWFVFIDADSVLLPYFFERIDQFIKTKNPQLFTTWFGPDSEKGGDVVLTLLGNLMIESATHLLKRPLAPGPLSIVSRDAFERIGGYDKDHDFHEDMDFSIRAVDLGFPIKILRETLYIVSLRRLRQQGTLRVAQQYVRATLPVLLFRKALRHMPGYVMGGQLYKTKKS